MSETPRRPRYDVVTLHPEMVEGPLHGSILGRGQQAGAIDVRIFNIRDHGIGKHRSVDDTPYGGGAGMVMRVDIVANALDEAREDDGYVIHMSPAGKRFTQADAERLAKRDHLVLLCGHYEGIDARIEHVVDEEISLGDFVLTGGELAACAIIDAVARLQPGVLGNAESALEESFTSGLLEHPQYTRPREWQGHEGPDILLSGHHANIAAWRHEQALERTRERRPDLLDATRGGSTDARDVDDPAKRG